jgi:hypothetical protein
MNRQTRNSVVSWHLQVYIILNMHCLAEWSVCPCSPARPFSSPGSLAGQADGSQGWFGHVLNRGQVPVEFCGCG